MTRTLRQWNINCLHGAASSPAHPVAAAAIMAVLAPINPDLIFFQESCVQSFAPPPPGCTHPPSHWDHLPSSSPRILQLHALLRAAGYETVQAAVDGCPNPAMLATRLPITSVEDAFIIDTEPFCSRMRAQQPPELRSARFVGLSVGQGGHAVEVVAVVSHLHHKETVESSGLRLAEVRCITQRLRATLRSNPRAAAVFATDFNSPRRQDYNPREWAVITQMKQKLGEVAVDGVAEELEREGFACTYGGSAPSFTHWSATTVDFACVDVCDDDLLDICNVFQVRAAGGAGLLGVGGGGRVCNCAGRAGRGIGPSASGA